MELCSTWGAPWKLCEGAFTVMVLKYCVHINQQTESWCLKSANLLNTEHVNRGTSLVVFKNIFRIQETIWVWHKLLFIAVWRHCDLNICPQESGSPGESVRQTQLMSKGVRDGGHRLERRERGGGWEGERVWPGEQPSGSCKFSFMSTGALVFLNL